MSNPMVRGFAHVATTLATVAIVLFVALSGALAGNGNNGTIKIHESGTPSMTPNNDPKVCDFNIEGFGFDVGQTGYIRFAVQGGDAPQGVDPGYNDPVTATDGTFATQYYVLARGHYKATLYDAAGTEKAKSKVFKVTCDHNPGGGGEGGGGIG